MNNKTTIETFWQLFSQGDYVAAKALFTAKPHIVWPTSREYYDDLEKFIEVNEIFGRDWNFELLDIEETASGKIITAVYATSPSFDDNFFANSFFSFSGGKISEMKTYWAFEAEQPEFRKGLSLVY